MVGREQELAVLQAALERAVTGRRWEVAVLVGAAGLGKTRLWREFVAWARAVCPGIRLVVGRCHAHTQMVPYAALADLLRGLFDIQADALAPVAVQKLTEGLRAFDPEIDAAEFRYRLGSLANVLGCPLADDPLAGLDPEQRRDRTFLTLERLILATAASGPFLVVLEDLQWADALSLSFVERLAQVAVRGPEQGGPGLLLAVSRVAQDPASPLAQALERLSELSEHSLVLQPLESHEMVTLAKDMLDGGSLPPQVMASILEHAGGNPFYVEETLLSLVEGGTLFRDPDTDAWHVAEGVQEVRVPPTVEEALAARLERLPPEEKRLAQHAAILGRTFWHRLLSEVAAGGTDSGVEAPVSEALSHLEQRRFLLPAEEAGVADRSQGLFRHVLVQEVAYSSVAEAVRRRIHRQAAHWLETCAAERISALTPMIAYHYERADVPNKAVAYLRQAGEQAAAQLANEEAVTYFSRALELLERIDAPSDWVQEQRYALLLGRERVCGLLGDRDTQAADLVQLTLMAHQMSNDRRWVEVALGHASYREAISDFSAARLSARRAVGWARRMGDVEREVQGLIAWGRSLWRQGAFEDARKRLEEGLALAQGAGNRRAEATSLHNLGTVLYFLGDYRAAQEHLERALMIRRELGDQRGEAVSLNNLAGIYHALGDFARAKTLTERALAIYQATGDRRNEIQSLSNLGTIHHALGALETARDYHERALGLFDMVGDRRGQALAAKNLGLVLHNLGHHEAAEDHCRQALAINRATGDRSGEGYSLTYLALALEGLERLEEAAAIYEEALRLRRSIGQEAQAIDDLAGLAEVALKEGRVEQALEVIQDALTWIGDHGLYGIEQPLRVYLVGGEAWAAAGNAQRAVRILEAGRDLLLERAARISDVSSREDFLHRVPLHRQLLERLTEARRSLNGPSTST
jgi:predicted ATPase